MQELNLEPGSSRLLNYAYVMDLKEMDRQLPGFTVALFIAWLLLMAVLFWQMILKYETVWVSFEGDDLPALEVEAGTFRVVHLVDPECPCTRFSLPHIAAVEATWESPDIHFETLTKGETSELGHQLDRFIPASPAVAVWDQSSRLRYFGPYTSGELCGQGDDLLASALAGTKGQRTNQESVGCFCDWKSRQA